MKRKRQTKTRKPDAIICADIHLRDSQPECREDDFFHTQFEKLAWLKKLQELHKCPILDAGDLLEKWKPSPELLSLAMKYIPDKFITVPGNHDLPQHDIHQLHRSGLYTLQEAGKITILKGKTITIPDLKAEFSITGIPWDQTLSDHEVKIATSQDTSRHILILHIMAWSSKKEKPHWSSTSDDVASGLLRKYHQFDLIITGHNHQTFTSEFEGRRLVNPGCLSRQKVNEMDHKPCVFLWFADDNELQQVFLPIKNKAVMRVTKSTEALKREKRLTSFVSSLKGREDLKLSFPDNMERYLADNDISKPIKIHIRKAMEGEV